MPRAENTIASAGLNDETDNDAKNKKEKGAKKTSKTRACPEGKHVRAIVRFDRRGQTDRESLNRVRLFTVSLLHRSC